MTPIDYHCKICRRPGVAYYDEACPINNLNAWKSCLCCERCYDFRDAFVKARRSIERLCLSLITARQTVKSSPDLAATEKKIRDVLERKTRFISSLCSRFYQIEDLWGFEMVSILMDEPTGCNRAIDAIRSHYSQTKRNIATQTELTN